MKYFKDTKGEVYAFESTEERAKWGSADLVEMAPAEVDAHLNPSRVPTADDHRAAIAAERYKHEVAGILVGGVKVDTDDRSKLLINGSVVEAMLNPDYVLQWKTTAGFMPLTAEQVIGVGRAVRAHVQACFDREAELLAEIDAGTYSEEMLAVGWPA